MRRALGGAAGSCVCEARPCRLLESKGPLDFGLQTAAAECFTRRNPLAVVEHDWRKASPKRATTSVRFLGGWARQT